MVIPALEKATHGNTIKSQVIYLHRFGIAYIATNCKPGAQEYYLYSLKQ